VLDLLAAVRKPPVDADRIPTSSAPAQWNPAKKLLICPFCGTKVQTPEEVDAKAKS